MRYYQAPQQQVVRIGNPQQQQQNVAFQMDLMNRTYQDMMQTKSMGLKAMEGLGNIEYYDDKAYQENILPLYEGITDAVSRNASSSEMMDILMKTQRQVVPFSRVSQAQARAGAEWDKIRVNDPNAVLGRDPRTRQTKDESGQFVSPETMKTYSFDNRNIRGIIGSEVGTTLDRIKIDPNFLRTGDTHYSRIDVYRGLADEDIERKFNPDSSEAKERIDLLFENDNRFKDVWLDHADGNPDKAKELASNYLYNEAKILLNEKVESNIQTSSVGTNRRNAPNDGGANTPPPSVPFLKSDTEHKDIPTTFQVIDPTVFDPSGNVATEFTPENHAPFHYKKLQEFQTKANEVRAELEKENYGLTENDFMVSDYSVGDIFKSPEDVPKKPISEAQKQRKIERKREELEKNLLYYDEHAEKWRDALHEKATEYSTSSKAGVKESEYSELLTKFEESLDLPEGLNQSQIANIYTDFTQNLTKNITSLSPQFSESFGIENVTGESLITPTGTLRSSGTFQVIDDKGKSTELERTSELITTLFPKSGDKAKDEFKAALEDADIRIYPIGGPSPGAVKYTLIRGDGTEATFWTKANNDIEQVLTPQHTVFNKAINMDFEEFDYPGTSALPILDDEGNPTGRTLVLTPESKIKIKPVTIDTGTTQQDRFTEGNEYPFYGIDFNLEVTDKEGNVYEIPMQSFIEGGTEQLNEMTLSDKKRKEINDYMFKNRQEGVDLQQSIMDIRGTVSNQFTELYGAPNEVTGLYVSPENVRSIPGFEGLNDYQVSVAGGLLNLISMGEGDYNRKVGQRISDDVLIDKTLTEIQKMQQDWKKTDVGKKMRSSAFGRYQFMDYTLFGKDGKPGMVQEYNIPMDEIFSPAMQDYLALLLLKRRGFDKYISGQISEDAFIDRLSQEWASVEHKSGRSYYEGDGVNKAHTSRSNVSQVLNQ